MFMPYVQRPQDILTDHANSLVGGLKDRLRAGLDLLFPWHCPVCDTPSDGPFCGDCRRELLEAAGQTCPRCAEPIGPFARVDGGCSACRGRSLGFDAAVALGPYQGPIRHLCLLLKYPSYEWVARWLAELWVEARGATLPVAARDEATRVVPVPLHWSRRVVRGYDQADSFAERLAGYLGVRKSNALRRVKATPKLVGLSRSERARTLRQAFQTRRSALAAIAGRDIILVDDILTTGATCGSAARALKRAGARRVVVAVIGRA